jgi:drug/metabolite transporter (DMT)-like permease
VLYLALSIACSIGTAALLKVVEARSLKRMPTLAVNYAAGFLLAFALARGAVLELSSGALMLGCATGALFLAGYFVFGAAIRQAGVGLATGIMRLSVVVPVLGAWLLYGEAPTGYQITGLAIAAGAFLLLAHRADSANGPEDSGANAALVLLLLFIAGGCSDLAMKVFARTFGSSVEEPAFLVIVFGVAATLAALLVTTSGGGRPHVGRSEVLIGAAIGVINYGSADFIIRAATAMPAAVVFPTLAITVLAATAILGRVVWEERLSGVNLAGLILAAIALALLWGA